MYSSCRNRHACVEVHLLRVGKVGGWVCGWVGGRACIQNTVPLCVCVSHYSHLLTYLQSPRSFLKEVMRGSASLFRSTVVAVTNSASRMSDAAAKVMAML